MSRRQRKGQKRDFLVKKTPQEEKDVTKSVEVSESKAKESVLKPEHKPKKGNFYEKNYKILLLIPFIILFLAMGQIGYQTYETGDFVNKGVTLKGGSTITIKTQEIIDINSLQSKLSLEFPGKEIIIRTQTVLGDQTGYIIDSEIQDTKELEQFESMVKEQIPNIEDYSV